MLKTLFVYYCYRYITQNQHTIFT